MVPVRDRPRMREVSARTPPAEPADLQGLFEPGRFAVPELCPSPARALPELCPSGIPVDAGVDNTRVGGSETVSTMTCSFLCLSAPVVICVVPAGRC